MQKEEKLRMKQSLVFAPISLILTHVTAWSVPGYPHIFWDREKGEQGGWNCQEASPGLTP